MAKKTDMADLDAANAATLVEMVVEPYTPDPLRIQILNKLLEGMESENFFDTIYTENLDVGECPHCVPQTTTSEEGPQWQQACKKKKITV